MVRRVLILILMFYGIPLSARIKEIHYTYGGNFRGKLWQPDPRRLSQKLPAIVYVYDEFLDRVGEDYAAGQGYDLNRHILEFARWNVVVIVPMERHRKLNAVKGAIYYLKSLPMVDPNRIHVVGVSEGAVIGMVAAQSDSVRSMVLITPLEINDKGIFSYKGVSYHKKRIMPGLLLSTSDDKPWEINDNVRLSWYHRQNKKFERKVYPYQREWFWNEKNAFMWDIRQFIHQNGGVDTQ